MPSLELKPTHKAVTAYYDSLTRFAKLGIKHEGAVRSAFQELLEHCARQFDWKLVGKSVKALIEKERQTNKKFIAAFEDFCSLCRGSLNPNSRMTTPVSLGMLSQPHDEN